MQKISKVIDLLLPHASFDAVGVGVIDFHHSTFEIIEKGISPNVYFDLASVTKPLTNSLSYFKRKDLFSPEMILCLNHRGGLPSWGLLSRHDWKDQILSYKIQEAPTLYSDFSALRVMLELEKKNLNQHELCKNVWDKQTVFWKELPQEALLVQTGFRNGVPNYGAVHDPNAWVINGFTSHAGLFSTISGLCRTLIRYQTETNFIEQVMENLKTHQHRFSFGWDRVMNPQETLAGSGCGPLTFGHLGFTGTSVWIDPQKKCGHVILTNAVKKYWYDKKVLNELRKAVGELVWSM